MKKYSQFLESKSPLTYIPPNISDEEAASRRDALEGKISKSTGMKYEGTAGGYYSDKKGNSTHHLHSPFVKSEHNKTYGGATQHHVVVTVNKHGKILSGHSFVRSGVKSHGEWDTHPLVYDHKPITSLTAAAKHIKTKLASSDALPGHKKRAEAIIYPHAYPET